MYKNIMLDDGGGCGEPSVPSAMGRSEYGGGRSSVSDKEYNDNDLGVSSGIGQEICEKLNDIQKWAEKKQNEIEQGIEGFGRDLERNITNTMSGQYSSPVPPDPDAEKARAIILATASFGLAVSGCAIPFTGIGALLCASGLSSGMVNLSIALAANNEQRKEWESNNYGSILNPCGFTIVTGSVLMGNSDKQSFGDAKYAKTVCDITKSLNKVYESKDSVKDYISIVKNTRSLVEQVNKIDNPKKNQTRLP